MQSAICFILDLRNFARAHPLGVRCSHYVDVRKRTRDVDIGQARSPAASRAAVSLPRHLRRAPPRNVSSANGRTPGRGSPHTATRKPGRQRPVTAMRTAQATEFISRATRDELFAPRPASVEEPATPSGARDPLATGPTHDTTTRNRSARCLGRRKPGAARRLARRATRSIAKTDHAPLRRMTRAPGINASIDSAPDPNIHQSYELAT